jgi:hypothetical protein
MDLLNIKRYILITKPNHLKLFREVLDVCSDNRTDC